VSFSRTFQLQRLSPCTLQLWYGTAKLFDSAHTSSMQTFNIPNGYSTGVLISP